MWENEMKASVSEAQRHVLWDMLNNYPDHTPTTYLVIWFYSDETYAEAFIDGLHRKYILDVRHKTLRSLRNLEKRGLIKRYDNIFQESELNPYEPFSWNLTDKGIKLALEISKSFKTEKQSILSMNESRSSKSINNLRRN